MTPVSIVSTTESYAVSLVSSDRQTSYDSGILRKATESYEVFLLGHHKGGAFTGTERNART